MDYFFDPVLRGPTIGSMFMCLGAAIIGVIVFLRKESLLGEALSHTTYPGVALGALAFYSDTSILLGAFFSALLGLLAIVTLEKRFRIHSDAALCFVLASFFGVGVTVASRLQFSYSNIYRNIQVYLYGQAATMDDRHIVWYAILSLTVITITTIFYKEIKTITFDSLYAKSLGIPVKRINAIFFVLVVFSIVIGIRSVGVVLMSAMLIAPAVAARQFSDHMGRILLYAGLFGLASGYLGNVFSYEFTKQLTLHYPGERLSLPTGPMIVMVAVFFSLCSLLFAPKKGWVIRLLRQFRFERECLRENILKEVWRNQLIDIPTLGKMQSTPQSTIRRQVRLLIRQGYMKRDDQGNILLTDVGTSRAAHIVRLHRLWELYLVDTLGIGAEKVHRSAEEMEHILTPDLERRLEELLKHPKYDPHKKPIPREPSL